MSDFRRHALDQDGSDRPAGTSPEVGVLFARQAAAAALLLRDRVAYPELLKRFQVEGPSTELAEAALELAGDIGCVLQSLRERPDLLDMLEDVPSLPGPPLPLLDQIYFSYLLLTDAAEEDQRKALLTPDQLEDLLSAPRVIDWMQRAGIADATP